MKTLTAVLVFVGVLIGGASAAGAADAAEGCVAVGPVAECTYTATTSGGIVAAGVWRLTIKRGTEVLHIDSAGLFDTYRGRDAVQPGDTVHVRTCFCICCPFIPSSVVVGPAVNQGAPR